MRCCVEQQQCRTKIGAAIITWKYTQPPYLDTGENIYNQMVTAYNAGAKYITIFDYSIQSNQITHMAVMTDEHFQALQKFWNQMVTKTSAKFSPC